MKISYKKFHHCFLFFVVYYMGGNSRYFFLKIIWEILVNLYMFCVLYIFKPFFNISTFPTLHSGQPNIPFPKDYSFLSPSYSCFAWSSILKMFFIFSWILKLVLRNVICRWFCFPKWNRKQIRWISNEN